MKLKKLFLIATIVALMGTAHASPTPTSGAPKCNGVANCNDIKVNDDSVTTEADARARSGAEADATGVGIGTGGNGTGIGLGQGGSGTGVGVGGSSSATGGTSISGSGVRGSGNADVDNRNSNENRNDNSSGASAIVGGDTTVVAVGGDRTYIGGDREYSDDDITINEGASDDDVIVEGDTNNSSYSYKYEEAASQAATLIASVCQDGTSLQGVKFGLSTVKQSLFCMYTTTAQLKFNAALMQDCGMRETIAKGGSPIPSPQPTECERSKRGLYLEGIELVDRAVSVADGQNRKGLGRKILGLLW